MSKKEVKIYVEGQGEMQFFTDLLLHRLEKQFIVGKKKLNSIYEDNEIKIYMQVFDDDSGHGGIDTHKITKLLYQIKEDGNLGIESYVIIDADTPEHKPAGGYKTRVDYLEKRKRELEVDFKFFIIPDNENDGNLETLLNNIIGDKGKPFFLCLNSYIDCLGNLDDDKPPRLKKEEKQHKGLAKIKFNWFSYYMADNKKSSVAQRSYQNDAWDLDSEKLNLIVDFFDNIFSEIDTNSSNIST